MQFGKSLVGVLVLGLFCVCVCVGGGLGGLEDEGVYKHGCLGGLGYQSRSRVFVCVLVLWSVRVCVRQRNRRS